MREGAIVEVETSAGISGIGEIAPLPEFGGGTLADALSFIPAITDQLIHRPLPDIRKCLADGDIYSKPSLAIRRSLTALTFGFETALLDAQGKHELCSVSTLLVGTDGPRPRTHIPVNAVVGIPSIAMAVEAAQQAERRGFGCVKLKVGNMAHATQEVERIKAVRLALAPATSLRLDANEAWTLHEATDILEQCADCAIEYIEQPLKAADLTGMRLLRERTQIPLAADEAIHDLASLKRVIAEKAADVVIIKPQLAGGLHTIQRMLNTAEQHGLQCVFTTTIEAGISLAATVHLAATAPAVTRACGLATSVLQVDDLLQTEIGIHNGQISVPTSAGLGVELDRVALEKYRYTP